MFLYRLPARWSRKAGVNPSSQWCWEPGAWSPRTTMKTAATTPPCLPAPVRPPSRWSSTNAVRPKRGRSSLGGSWPFHRPALQMHFHRQSSVLIILPDATTWSSQILEVGRSATTWKLERTSGPRWGARNFIFSPFSTPPPKEKLCFQVSSGLRFNHLHLLYSHRRWRLMLALSCSSSFTLIAAIMSGDISSQWQRWASLISLFLGCQTCSCW